jgi:hypothetical protein
MIEVTRALSTPSAVTLTVAALLAPLWPTPLVHARAPLEAYFMQRSYAPGQRAALAVSSDRRRIAVRLFHAGLERGGTDGNRTMNGVPVTRSRILDRRPRIVVRIRRGWDPGVYFARLRAGRDRVAFAPVVVRARASRRPRVAVVLPTHTWQAYNFRDDNGDGIRDSWYADSRVRSVDISRPFANRGVPPHWGQYDEGFQRWMAHTAKRADYLTDDDLDRTANTTTLLRRYDLMVFAGHEEYVTPHTYSLISGYRDRGGNLMFLSANNFFYRVLRKGDRITRSGRWRDLGRPEARWIGVQYLDWWMRIWPNRAYVLTGSRGTRWVFRGTGLRRGDRFGSYGIEIDNRTRSSPPGVRVLARIPNIFGPGRSAEMAYHRTYNGAKVFAAGALDFGDSAPNQPVSTMLENLWARLSRP